MILELKTSDTRFAIGQGSLVLCLGLVLGVLGSYMANPDIVPYGYAAAILLTTLCLFTFAATVGSRIVITEKWRQPRFFLYLWATSALFAGWGIVWFFRPASVNLLDVVAALLGIYISLWYLRMALQRHSSFWNATSMSMLGVSTSAIGILIATQSGITHTSAVTATSCFTMWAGSQILITAFYLAWSRRSRGRRKASAYYARFGSRPAAELVGSLRHSSSSM